MNIKVLGPGCGRCKKLYAEAEKAVAAAGVSVELEKVEKLEDIMQYPIMATPALVIDGEVKAVGKVPRKDEILGWLRA